MPRHNPTKGQWAHILELLAQKQRPAIRGTEFGDFTTREADAETGNPIEQLRRNLLDPVRTISNPGNMSENSMLLDDRGVPELPKVKRKSLLDKFGVTMAPEPEY